MGSICPGEGSSLCPAGCQVTEGPGHSALQLNGASTVGLCTAWAAIHGGPVAMCLDKAAFFVVSVK